LFASGTISTHNTVFEAYGQKLTVERGIVNFSGPLDNPGLNVLAVRQNLPVEAGVEVLGTVRRPKIRLVSTPEVSDAEKLSWIIAGRSLESGGVDPTLLLAAAGSILGGQSGSGGITRQLSQALGVDEISFRQSDTITDDGNPLANQIGSVGKRLSSRAYLSYEHGLTTTTDISVAKLTYSLTPKIKVVTQAGTDSAIDIFYTIQFD
jgi:translocation and assembly module TamB